MSLPKRSLFRHLLPKNWCDRGFFAGPVRATRTFRPRVEELELRLTPSTFTVTDTSDNAADPGSLRHAILQAASAGSGTIVFSLIAGQNTITLENTATYPNGF